MHHAARRPAFGRLLAAKCRTAVNSQCSKGAPGFECWTKGPGGGEASEGLKKFTKVRLKIYF